MKYQKNINAIILCGGKGLRLRPITKDIPKPLIKIGEKPILFYIIKHLLKYKIKNFIIATGYKSKKIEDFMINTFPSLNYKIVNSGNVAILDRIKDCLQYIEGDFILNYGDTLSNINIEKLIEFHNKKSSHVTITSFPITIPFGVMQLNQNGIVKDFQEKPTLQEVMNIGYYYFTTASHDKIKKSNDLVKLIKSLIKSNQLKCYQHKGLHITINTVSELEYAQKNIRSIIK